MKIASLLVLVILFSGCQDSRYYKPSNKEEDLARKVEKHSNAIDNINRLVGIHSIDLYNSWNPFYSRYPTTTYKEQIEEINKKLDAMEDYFNIEYVPSRTERIGDEYKKRKK